MNARLADRWQRVGWGPVLVSLAVLTVCLFYTYALTFLARDPGIEINPGWDVLRVDPCQDHPGWCEANPGGLRVGDRLTAIGDLSYETYRNDRRQVPFDGYGPGDEVPIVFSRNGSQETILWLMPAISGTKRVRRLSGLLFYLPFWLVSTAVLLFLRPRDQRWRLLIAFHYLMAVWLATGLASSTQVAASSLVLHAVTWLFVPICLHLHLLVPAPLYARQPRHLVPLLYTLAIALGGLELAQLLPRSAYILGLLLAVLGSLGLLGYRLFGKSSRSVRSAATLMLGGIGLSFGPGIVLVLVPMALGSPAPGVFEIAAALSSIPILPLSYVYVIYKRYLGGLEFRANRLLGLYSFVLLYAVAFALVHLLRRPWLDLPGASLGFDLIVSVVFVSVAPGLRKCLQRLVDRLAYGTKYDPDDIVSSFARQITATLNADSLSELLASQVMPSLLVRQSALYLLTEEGAELFYASGIRADGSSGVRQQLLDLLIETARYRPIPFGPTGTRDERLEESEFGWVRLAVPLRMQERTTGVWLFGRRDPDDYYPRPDVMLLATLADQVAIALENIRLYGQAQCEITERKRMESALQEANDELERRVKRRTAELATANEQLTQEIIERKRAEAELVHRNEQLTALNAVAEAIGRWPDLGCILEEVLDTVLEVLGADAGWIQLVEEESEVLSLAAHRGLSPEMVQAAQAIRVGEGLAGRVVESGEPVVVAAASDASCFGVERGGGEALHAFVGVPLRSQESVLGVLGVCSHSLDESSSQQVALLQAIGHQVGVAVENARLGRMASEVEVLREVDRLRSELVANVSHELRTPLGLIKIFGTSLLREDAGFDAETREGFLRGIEEETEKLEEIVDHLLDAARLESGRLRLERRATDLGELVRRTLEAMEAQLAGHRLESDFPPEALVARVDEEWGGLVLRNLLSNAIKYSPEGGWIGVRGYRKEGEVVVCVSDEGIGIPVGEQGRVFERFYRVDNEVTRRTRGVGLGLAVCKGIVEAHGGQIWVESAPGAGSTFCFALPVGVQE